MKNINVTAAVTELLEKRETRCAYSLTNHGPGNVYLCWDGSGFPPAVALGRLLVPGETMSAWSEPLSGNTRVNQAGFAVTAVSSGTSVVTVQEC